MQREVTKTNKPFSKLHSVVYLRKEGEERRKGRRRRRNKNKWEGSLYPAKPKAQFLKNQSLITLGAHLEFKKSVLFVCFKSFGPNLMGHTFNPTILESEIDRSL